MPNVFQLIDGLIDNLQQLRQRLAPLASFAAVQSGRPAPRPARKAKAARPAKPGPKVKKRRAKKGLRDQGRYLGALRGLTKAQRVEIREIRGAKGIEAALDEAAKLKAAK